MRDAAVALFRASRPLVAATASRYLPYDRASLLANILDTLTCEQGEPGTATPDSWIDQALRLMLSEHTCTPTDILDDMAFLQSILATLRPLYTPDLDAAALDAWLNTYLHHLSHQMLTHYHQQVNEQLTTYRQSVQNLEQHAREQQQQKEQLIDRLFDLEVLYDLTRQIGYMITYPDLMRLIQENLHRAMPYDVAVGLVLADNLRSEWTCRASRPLSPKLKADIRARVQTVIEQFTLPVLFTGELPEAWKFHIDDPAGAPIEELQSVFLVPFLINNTELVGLLMVGAAQSEAFYERQVRLLYTVANQAVLSIEQLRNLLASEQRGMENLVRNLPVGILVLDKHNHIQLTNPPAESFLSMLGVERLDKPLHFLGSFSIDELVADGQHWELTASASQPRILRVSGAAITDTERNIENRVLVLNDITERKQAEERIRYMALYDTLTDLPNRSLFRDRLKRAMVQAQRSGRQIGVMFLDLDHFKAINDTLGHDVGDELLKIVAQRLKEAVRASDTVARLGGDEFTVILVGLVNAQDATLVAQKILKSLSQPFYVQGRVLYSSASIGITFYPSDGSDIDTLIKNADIAMYRAKNQGRSNYALYTPDMHIRALEWLTLERDLRQSFEQGAFFLHYQPQINLRTRQIVGLEVLVRWQHPELGLLTPERFLPIAEESGLIIPLGTWVLQTACAQNRAWQRAGLTPVNIAINLSARQLAHPDLVSDVANILRDTGLNPSYLVLELSEYALNNTSEIIIGHVQALKQLGIGLTIEDFGMGYLSLSSLKRLAIDTLKIDRSFVRDLPTNQDNAAITSTIIAVTRSLNLKVIAEGVESEHQQAFLLQQGCDEIQGYLYSEPVATEEITRLLQRHTRQPMRPGP